MYMGDHCLSSSRCVLIKELIFQGCTEQFIGGIKLNTEWQDVLIPSFPPAIIQITPRGLSCRWNEGQHHASPSPLSDQYTLLDLELLRLLAPDFALQLFLIKVLRYIPINLLSQKLHTGPSLYTIQGFSLS